MRKTVAEWKALQLRLMRRADEHTNENEHREASVVWQAIRAVDEAIFDHDDADVVEVDVSSREVAE